MNVQKTSGAGQTAALFFQVDLRHIMAYFAFLSVLPLISFVKMLCLIPDEVQAESKCTVSYLQIKNQSAGHEEPPCSVSVALWYP